MSHSWEERNVVSRLEDARPTGRPTKGVPMEVASTKATLVESRDVSGSVTATIPRAEFEAALASEERAELFLEVSRPEEGLKRDVSVAWSREDLERLFADTEGTAITLTFDRSELIPTQRDADVALQTLLRPAHLEEQLRTLLRGERRLEFRARNCRCDAAGNVTRLDERSLRARHLHRNSFRGAPGRTRVF